MIRLTEQTVEKLSLTLEGPVSIDTYGINESVKSDALTGLLVPVADLFKP